MKAAQINEYGDKDVVKIQETDKPPIAPDQVLVEVRAASVNPFDNAVRSGYAKDWITASFPFTLGGDVSGIAAAVGSDVTGFEPGDEVFGQANATSGWGSLAEYTPVKAVSLAKKPAALNWIDAAAIPLTASSAVQALFDHLNLQAGQSILIHGGAGGIGSFAVQLAKQAGATVYSTASTEQIDFVKSLGADEVIDYTKEDFTTQVKELDAVYDTIGGETFTKSHEVLKPGGTIVSMVGPANEALAKERNVTQIVQQSKVTTDKLDRLAEAAEAGHLKVNIDKVFPLDETADALDYLQNGRPKGKVVVQVK